MTANGYVRQSAATIVTSNTIQASDFNNEYNALQTAFDGTVGHDHSGGSGLSQKISLTAAVSGILPAANGGTSTAYFTVLGLTAARNITFPDVDGTAVTLAATQTLTNKTLTSPIISTISNTGTLTLPTSSDTLVGRATTDTLTNKTFDTASNTFKIAGTTITTTGSGAVVLATSPTLVTPVLGVASATTINKVTLTTPASGSTLTIADGKTLTASNTLTFTGTDTSSIAFGGGGTVAYTNVTTLSSLTSVGTIATGVWQGTVVGATYGGTGVNNGSNTITLGGNVSTAGAFTTSGAFGITLTATALTSVTLPTSGTLVNTAVTSLSSLATVGTIGTGVWQGTKIGTLYGGTNLDSSASTGIAQVSSGTWSVATSLPNGTTATTQSATDNSTKVATTAYVDGLTISASKLAGMSNISAVLGADVALSNTGTFFDGPNIAQGTSGTWLVIGTVTLGSGGNSTYFVTLNDGTTVYSSAASSSPSTVGSQWNSCTLSAIVTNPAANLRISVKDTVRTDGNIKFNVTGNSKDSSIKAIRIG